MKTIKKSKFDYKTIKSFEDACKKLGVEPTALPEVSMLLPEFQKAIVNMYKLYIIYKAINDGWLPDWSDSNQYKYYPWYLVLPSGAGFDDSNANYYYTYTYTSVGSRLCTYSKEVSLYIANTFGEEYSEIFLITE